MKKTIKRIGIILRYFFFEGTLTGHLKRHLELVKVLDPFKKAGLIGYNPYSIYLFSYISRSLHITTKLRSLIHNYSFLKNNFSPRLLQQIFTSGMQLYKEQNGEDEFKIVLATSSFLEIEGSLSLFLKVNNIKVAVLSFTFVPGEVFHVEDENVIYISCLQRVGKQADNIAKAIKNFKDIIPAVILLKSLEAIADCLNIKRCIGIMAKDQLSFDNTQDYEKYHAVYDEFWKLNSGVLVNGNYIIPIPIRQKDILLVKQTHRNRARKKRQKLSEIYLACYDNINNSLSHSPSLLTEDFINQGRLIYKPA